MKQKKKKTVGREMRFGVNTAAPFVGMKREDGSDYPFAKQVRSQMFSKCGRATTAVEPRILVLDNPQSIVFFAKRTYLRISQIENRCRPRPVS